MPKATKDRDERRDAKRNDIDALAREIRFLTSSGQWLLAADRAKQIDRLLGDKPWPLALAIEAYGGKRGEAPVNAAGHVEYRTR